MKNVPIRRSNEAETLNILRMILGGPIPRGMDIETMRQRIKLLDRIDAVPSDAEAFLLEDAEHAKLCDFLRQHTYGAANRDLLAILDDVLDAKEPQKLEAVSA
jgi:hypothetical protein